jgi:HAMP domain-containing protein
MSIVSLKLKYAAAASLTVLFGTIAVMSLLAWQYQVDSQRLGTLAQGYTRERVAEELQARATAMAQHAADAATPALQPGGEASLAERLQRFVDDKTVSAIVVRDAAGQVLFQWRRPGGVRPGVLEGQALQSIQTTVAIPSEGIETSKTLGEVRMVLAQAAPPERTGSLVARLNEASRADLQRTLLLVGTLAGLGGLIGAVFGWRAGRRLERPIAACIRSAERISQGDYTRPLDVWRKDELGELQHALERMRGKLRQTTINKNYLHNVLNSMNDAVFVTSPDGVVKVANSAA